MIIYKLHINASLNGSKAVSAPLLACSHCSLLEDVLVPCSICIFALNGIFCFDRRGEADKATTKTKLLSMHRCALSASSYRKADGLGQVVAVALLCVPPL